MCFKSIFVLLLSLALSVYGVDYCSSKLDCFRLPHVACNNSLARGGWGSACKSSHLIQLTDEIKEVILDNQNKRRNEQALGNTPNYEPAVRMATLQWDPELAKLAEMNVRSCVYAHDACTNTHKYKFSGQNIAMSLVDMTYTEKRSDAEVVNDLISDWFDTEHGNGKYWGWMKFIDSFSMPPESDTERQIGHFTQVVRDQAYSVGCAAARFVTSMTGSETKAVLITCNYSVTNMYGEKVYESGPTASKCTSGTNSKYPGLCSPDEKYETTEYYN